MLVIVCCLLSKMVQGQEMDTLEVKMLHRRCIYPYDNSSYEIIIRTYDEYLERIGPEFEEEFCPKGVLTAEDFEKYDLVNHDGIPYDGCEPPEISQIIVRWPMGLLTSDVFLDYGEMRAHCRSYGQSTFSYWFLVEKLAPDEVINFTHHKIVRKPKKELK